MIYDENLLGSLDINLFSHQKFNGIASCSNRLITGTQYKEKSARVNFRSLGKERLNSKNNLNFFLPNRFKYRCKFLNLKK